MARGHRRLNLFMAKPLGSDHVMADLLTESQVDTYPMADTLGLEGSLYVKRSAEKRPNWGDYPLDPLVQAPARHPESNRHFLYRKATLGHLPNWFDFEFFRVLRTATHDTSSLPKL